MIVTDGIHLTSTNLTELHDFAAKIGLKPDWFQDNRIPHYDIWGIMKKRALDAGAHKVHPFEIVKMWRNTMKAITIQQPWASAIMAGIKIVENRTWATHYTGPLVIHAGLQPWPHDTSDKIYKLLFPICPLAELERGVILGIVDLIGCEEYNDSFADNPFATGPVCWKLENPRRLKMPVPYSGKLGLWNVPDDLIKEIL